MQDAIEIAADAETVWPLVADPVRHAEWNSKVISIDRAAEGPVALGERFSMLYRMPGRRYQTAVEVIACEPPRRVVFEHRTRWNGREQVTRESYEIVGVSWGVRVTQTVDLSGALPWWSRALIWFIHTFGQVAGTPTLENMRDMAEAQEAAQETRDSTENREGLAR